MASKVLLVILLAFLSSYQSRGDTRNNNVESACELAPNRTFCEWSLSQSGGSAGAGPKNLSEIVMRYSLRQAKIVKGSISGGSSSGLSMQSQAIEDCNFLYGLTVDYLMASLAKLTNSTNSTVGWKSAVDIQSYLSAALTNQATCLEGLKLANVKLRQFSFTNGISNASDSVSSSLALMKKFFIAGKAPPKRSRSVHSRRLLSDDDFVSQYGSVDDGLPSWLSRADRRRLLQSSSGDGVLVGDVVTVAQDGSGNYTTITDAINAAANQSADRCVIYVTAGVYEEYVQIPKYKYNIMLIGDGIDVTVITGNRSVVDGWTTFNSATVAAVGQGFLARDITFENTAGAEKHQAVALRVGSDLSAFYRCSIKGYQDTLYTHSLRQFYRECDIYGTVDFIFGNAAVVFQSCNLLARKPMDQQQNLFTAQGRTDPNQNTGTSIVNCNVTAAPELVPVISSFPTYLGRPWKQYSRTVYIQSYLDSVVQPAGWLAWSGDFALSTLYYGEYANTGPGANTSQRVSWPGYRVMNNSDAQNFTVTSFIAGDTWLSSAAVPFDAGLL
uniref:Pectinesterase n=1 Tax=Cunninghamia lanceolata TaxID=28977 RepID=A0A6G9W224_CUNLA|nr:pectin methylesterase 26 [Cunninghamia lanceolata]